MSLKPTTKAILANRNKTPKKYFNGKQTFDNTQYRKDSANYLKDWRKKVGSKNMRKHAASTDAHDRYHLTYGVARRKKLVSSVRSATRKVAKLGNVPVKNAYTRTVGIKPEQQAARNKVASIVRKKRATKTGRMQLRRAGAKKPA